VYELVIIGFTPLTIKLGSFVAEKRAIMRRFWSKSRNQFYCTDIWAYSKLIRLIITVYYCILGHY